MTALQPIQSSEIANRNRGYRKNNKKDRNGKQAGKIIWNLEICGSVSLFFDIFISMPGNAYPPDIQLTSATSSDTDGRLSSP